MDIVIQAEVSTVELHSEAVQVKVSVGSRYVPVLFSSAWVAITNIFMLGTLSRAPGLILS